MEKKKTLPVKQARQLDELCDNFEQRWSEDSSAELLKETLAAVPHEYSSVFVESIVELDLELRQNRGLPHDVNLYLHLFPDHSSLIQNVVGLRVASSGSLSHSSGMASTIMYSQLPQFENFQSIRCLGQGGMGLVVLAWDLQLKRHVAIKMIRKESWPGSPDEERFLEEARTMGAMQHPNIVSIFSVGTHEQGPFLVMEFVPGGSLAEYISRQLPSTEESVRIIVELAKAVEYAHELGIIHRDLNPHNILLGKQGTPKVADFGLAKWVSSETLSLESGLVVGTPSYMSPEQARGSRAVGTQADVYGLGAVLYELLTGRPPFRGPSPLVTLDQVREHEPVAPIQLQPSIARDLNTICLKCLRKDPNDRYSSVLELREDLQRFQQGSPILARPVGRIIRLGRWMTRNPAVSLLGLGTLLAITLGITGTVWQLYRAESHLASVLQEKELHERNFVRAQSAVDYLAQLSARLPQSLAARKELLQTAEKFYRQLAEERRNNPVVNHGWGLTLLRLGRVCGDLGMHDEAIAAYREALRVERQLLLTDPADHIAQRHIAGVAQNLAGILRYYGDKHQQEYLSLQRESVDAWAKLTGDESASYESRIEHSKSIFSLSILLNQAGLVEESQEQLELTLRVLDSIEKRVTNRSEATLVRVRALSHKATFHEKLEQWIESRQLHEQAVQLCQQILLQDPDSNEKLLELADLQNNLAIACKKLADYSSAQLAYSQAIAAFEKLLQLSPDDASVLQGLSRTQLNLGILAFERKSFSEASTAFQQAVHIHRRLLDLSPNNPDIKMKLQARIKRLVASQIAQGDTTGARETIELRKVIWPDDAEQAWIAAVEFGECVRQLRSSHPEGAIDSLLVRQLCDLAIDRLRSVIEEDPKKYSQLGSATELDYLHGTEEFDQLVQAVDDE